MAKDQISDLDLAITSLLLGSSPDPNTRVSSLNESAKVFLSYHAYK